MTTYVYTFEMDDGRVVDVTGEDEPNIEEILNNHLGKRATLRGSYDPDATSSNSVMTKFLIKA